MINYISLFSGMIGALIGGFIAWLNVRYSLDKQFKQQRKKEEIQDHKNEIIALNSIEKELTYNLIHLKIIEKLMVETKMEYIDFKLSNQNNNLKMDKWIKHSDTIEFIEKLGFLSIIQTFYFNLSHEINNQQTNLERVKKLISQGLDLDKLIIQYIKDNKTVKSMISKK